MQHSMSLLPGGILLFAHPTLRPLRTNRDSSSSSYPSSRFMRLPRILTSAIPFRHLFRGKPALLKMGKPPYPGPAAKRSTAICSGCHQPAPGYDQSPTPRRLEFSRFLGLPGLPGLLHATGRLHAAGWWSKKCLGHVRGPARVH